MANWVSAFFTIVIAIATVAYVVLTRRLWEETKRSADAAQTAADAAQKSADAAQENIDLTTRQFAEQLGLGPRIVLDAIRETQLLINYWSGKATAVYYPPQANPDPKGLESPSLIRAVEHARRVSDTCAVLIVDANANLRSARSELEAAFAAAKHQALGLQAGKATLYLQTANDLLAKAQSIVLEHIRPAD